MNKVIAGFNVNISYKKNMKTIKFRFKDGILHISCPKISDREIEKYINLNKNSFVDKIEESKLSNEFTYIQGKKYNIKYVDNKLNNIIIEEDELIVPLNREDLIIDFFIKDVELYIKSKENEFRSKFSNYPNFRVKKLKSSFGQYNKKTHTITLDYKLAKYDRIYLYLTLAHEFCHIVHFDHSKEFYDFLDSFVPCSKQMHKVMKKIKMNDIF